MGGAAGGTGVGAIVRINEIESSAGGGLPDWVELYNAGDQSIDIGGWQFLDDDDTRSYAIPSGTILAAGAFLVLEEDASFTFGLGSADSARLRDAASNLIDSHSWTSHATVTYGRCPDGTGDFTTTATATKGTANDCP
jgi:hypothetical protein